MTNVISTVEQVTPEWLTAVLQRQQLLPSGAALAIKQERNSAFNSNTVHLKATFTENVPAGVPNRFVLKCNLKQDWAIEAGVQEATFYQTVAALPDHPDMIVRCYDAAIDQMTSDSTILLQDLSESHAPSLMREQQINIVDAVPTPTDLARVVDTLAHFHAYWWQHPLLASGRFHVGYWSRNAERFALYQQRRQRSWDSLVTQERDWLPEDIRTLYEWVLTRLPYHWEHYLAPRFRDQTHLTLVHGDAYFANFLCPKQGNSGATYLLDWQSPSVQLAGYDLVNLIAPFWTRVQRHDDGREQKVLQRYYTTLCAHGVTGYSWEELLTDYRSGLIYWLLMPVQDRYGGAGKDYWWPKMQCLVAAFEDWNCQQLLING